MIGESVLSAKGAVYFRGIIQLRNRAKRDLMMRACIGHHGLFL
jgi:hypothetical protein